MNSPLALSPVHDASRRQVGKQATASDLLTITDYSLLPRAGVKGPGAAAWLEALGLSLPSLPNSWLELPNGGLIARLGQTEYLVDGNAAMIEAMSAAARTPGVYPVLRQDASFALAGRLVNELWLQTCNVDFRTLDADPTKLLLTSVVGVSVTVVPVKTGALPCYRLWCDGTYGLYLWDTMSEIITELGGGIALDTLP